MKLQYPLFWIGIRESELNDTGDFFTGSITIFGSGQGTNYSFDKEFNYRYDYNQESDLLDTYINQKAMEIIEQYPNSRFMLYYPTDVTILYKEILDRIICVNDLDIINLLENKIDTRIWLSDIIPVPPYVIEYGENISFKSARKKFPNYKKFVIQADYSCGGSNTWLFHELNADEIGNRLFLQDKYTVSPYFQDSISLNIHLIIYDKGLLLLPASVQLISLEKNNFKYLGADFIAYRNLPEHIHLQLERYSQKIGARLQLAGYRGVLGIDFIATDAEVYFMEINARFQSSTFLINKALSQKYRELSVQMLNWNAFMHKDVPNNLNFTVNYSFYSYQYVPEFLIQIQQIYSRSLACPHIIECQDDHLDWNMKLDRDTYLFKLVADVNLSALSPEHRTLLRENLRIQKNVLEMTVDWEKQLLELKIMLLSRGIHVNTTIQNELSRQGGINYEEFEALDLIINDKFYVSVPYLTILSELSPFEIIYEEKKLFLTYYGKPLTEVRIRFCNPNDKRKSKSGLLYEDISYMGHDRLRIYYRNGCWYKEQGIGCQFCDIDNSVIPLPIEDIKEVIDFYSEEPSLQHYLIGGGSDPSFDSMTKILEIAKYIHVKNDKPIYLMITPPDNLDTLHMLYAAGITEVAFNLEVFNRTLAQKYMPGKGSIPLDCYEKVFREAVRIWGNKGAVRSMVIVGLESEESLLKGIEYLCTLGVAPILSLLKPIAGTPLHYLLPPSDETVLHIARQAQIICRHYDLELGPSCHYCEDNSIKITYPK